MGLTCITAFRKKNTSDLQPWPSKAHTEAPGRVHRPAAILVILQGSYSVYGQNHFKPTYRFQGRSLSHSFLLRNKPHSLKGFTPNRLTATHCIPVSHAALAFLIQTPWSYGAAAALIITPISQQLYPSPSNLTATHPQPSHPSMRSTNAPPIHNRRTPSKPCRLSPALNYQLNWGIICNITSLMIKHHHYHHRNYYRNDCFTLPIITQWGNYTYHTPNIKPSQTWENALVTLYLFPLWLLSLNPIIIWGSFDCKYNVKEPMRIVNLVTEAQTFLFIEKAFENC